jgi:fructose/tagatose bisphosphate aldolase
MPIITQYNHVKEVYADAASRGWVIPCICSENLTTTEAVISSAAEFADENGLKHIPITIAMTVCYNHRPQAVHYSHTRRWDIGLRLFRSDIEILSDAFPNVDILIHLDHIQHDDDCELLGWDLSQFSSIMYDASTLPFESNIKKTAEYSAKMKGKILIEGACDEIVDATGSQHNEITSPSDALFYINETGVDMVVANLGTEHRASGKDLRYHSDAARLIKEQIGTKIVLHGTSSVSNDQITHLFSDGICKVNIWTAIERDSAPDMLDFIVRNASEIAGISKVDELVSEGFLTEKCITGKRASLAHFTRSAISEPVYKKMKSIIRAYLDMWYKL